MQVLKVDVAVQIMSLLLTSCVTLDKFLNFPVGQPTIPYPKSLALDVFLDSDFFFLKKDNTVHTPCILQHSH